MQDGPSSASQAPGAGREPASPNDVTLLQKEGHVQVPQKPLGQGQDEGEVSAALSPAQK